MRRLVAVLEAGRVSLGAMVGHQRDGLLKMLVTP